CFHWKQFRARPLTAERLGVTGIELGDHVGALLALLLLVLFTLQPLELDIKALVARVHGLALNGGARADIPGPPLWANSGTRVPQHEEKLFDNLVSNGK